MPNHGVTSGDLSDIAPDSTCLAMGNPIDSSPQDPIG